jgi:hypothetical protein
MKEPAGHKEKAVAQHEAPETRHQGQLQPVLPWNKPQSF